MNPSLLSSLRLEVRRYSSVLVGAADGAFASFASPDAVVDVLADTSAGTYAARDTLIAAIVREHRVRPHRLWSALLMVAFAPLLTSLRRRLRSELSAEDLDQGVLTAFLSAITAVNPKPGKVAAQIRSMTERNVFRALGKDNRRREHEVASGLVDNDDDDSASACADTAAVPNAVDTIVDAAGAVNRSMRRRRKSLRAPRANSNDSKATKVA